MPLPRIVSKSSSGYGLTSTLFPLASSFQVSPLPSLARSAPTRGFAFHLLVLYMLLAILLPGISMILNGHVFKGIVCGVLHLTLIGWIPAAIWAVASRSQDLAEKRHRETLAVLARQQR